MNFREILARRAALELKDGECVNLGFGVPTGVPNFIPDGIEVILQSENGCLLFGPTPELGVQDADVGNAGGQPITLQPGASIFDAAVSFGIIRGGHVDATFLGALEVDQEGNIANWAIPLAPGRFSPGPGGAMDLVTGARKVVAMLQHVDKRGNPKVKKRCTMELTGAGVLDVIITDKAVFYVNAEGLVLKEIMPDITVEELREITEADFAVAPDLAPYRLS